MTSIPHDTSLDNSLNLLKEGYLFISNRCQRLGADLFETRIMLQKAVCMMGEEAASVFYNPRHFTRKGAMPPTTLKLLQDKGSVAMLDGEDHHWRKQLFLDLTTQEQVEQLADIMEAEWRLQLAEWEKQDEVKLLDDVQLILCRAVCMWAGVPLTDEEGPARAREFAAMFESAGSFGPKALGAILLRKRTEHWAKDLIKLTRDQRINVPEGSPLSKIASHRDRKGELLDLDTATTELINLLRPTVAVSLYVLFAAVALHDHPECRPKISSGSSQYLESFVQEVRRHYPFFPFVGGRVLESFEWRGHHFKTGSWVLMDLYGTNHDSRIWGDPNVFRPERFLEKTRTPFDFIPQGGGDHHQNHRCPGEIITVTLMKRAVFLLTSAMQYEVPEQDLTIDLSKLPAIPGSRFVMRSIQAVAPVVQSKRERGR